MANKKKYGGLLTVAAIVISICAWNVANKDNKVVVVKNIPCICEDCAVDCNDKCKACVVKILDNGNRMVCRGDKCIIYETVLPSEE